MNEISQVAIVRVGVDLSKKFFQVHAVTQLGEVSMAKAYSRDRFFTWCAELPSGCMVAMESCGGAHHVARRLRAMGLDARLIAGSFVTGVLSRNRRKFRQPINVACPAPGRWGRPNSRVTSRHFDHGNASRTSRPDCSGLDEAD